MSMRLGVLLVKALGPLMLLVAAIQSVPILMRPTVPGVIVSNAPGTRGWDDALLYPTFTFTAKDGKSYTVTSPDGTKPGRLTDGKAITVRYQTARPEAAEVDSVWTSWAMPSITAFFGVGTTFAAFLAIPICVFILQKMRAYRERRAAAAGN